MTLDDWAHRWRISPDAINDLRTIMGIRSQLKSDDNGEPRSEAQVKAHRRLMSARRGNVLWSNPVGACRAEDGRMIRYGIANDSKSVNARVKSSDLIGITKHLIRPTDVGKIVGVFTAEETKKQGWEYSPLDLHARAQRKFLDIVLSYGGIARFTTGD